MKERKCFYIFACIIWMSSVALTGCGGGEGDAASHAPVARTVNTGTTLVQTVSIAAGSACPNGGEEIKIGFDQNDNQKLDDNEVDEARTQVICHGTNGTDGFNSLITATDEPAGENCTYGGQKITIGLDINQNGFIDEEEITTSQYLCEAYNTVNVDPCVITGDESGQKILDCQGAESEVIPFDPAFVDFTLETIDGGQRIVDSWLASGGNQPLSFKNNHYYFDVLEGGDVDFNFVAGGAAATTGLRLFVFDHNNLLVSSRSSGALNVTLEAGTYVLVPTISAKNAALNYKVELVGAIDNIRKVAAQHIKIRDKWESSGGQDQDSLRNHHYSFEIERRSFLDIWVQSNANERLYLVDYNNGVTTGPHSGVYGEEIDPGKYTLVVATNSAFQSFDYSVNMVSQFKNESGIPIVSKKESVSAIRSGDWGALGSGGDNKGSLRNDHYTFDVTEDSYIDIALDTSAGSMIDPRLYLVDSKGFSLFSGTSTLKGEVSLGSYTLVVGTHFALTLGEYVLSTVGQFENLSQVTASNYEINASWEGTSGALHSSLGNPRYTIEAIQSGTVDIIVDATIRQNLYLLNESGIVIKETLDSSNNRAHLVADLTVGEYTIVIATDYSDQQGSFVMHVNGLVSEPVRQ